MRKDKKPTRSGPGGETEKQRPKFKVKLNQKSNFGSGPSNRNSGPSNRNSGPSNRNSGPSNRNSKSPKFGKGKGRPNKFGPKQGQSGPGGPKRDGFGKKKRKVQVFNSQGVGPNFRRK